MKAARFKKLKVWNDSMKLAEHTYLITTKLKEENDYVLSNQMWRSCVSISSNIAEGSNSGSDTNFIRYLNIALASLAEYRSQLDLCERLQIRSLEDVDLHQIDDLADAL